MPSMENSCTTSRVLGSTTSPSTNMRSEKLSLPRRERPWRKTHPQQLTQTQSIFPNQLRPHSHNHNHPSPSPPTIPQTPRTRPKIERIGIGSIETPQRGTSQVEDHPKDCDQAPWRVGFSDGPQTDQIISSRADRIDWGAVSDFWGRQLG